MFTEWGFLLTEIWVLLALMALIGLFAGWLIWGRQGKDCDARIAAKEDDIRRLRAELDRKKADEVSPISIAGVTAPPAPFEKRRPVVEDVSFVSSNAAPASDEVEQPSDTGKPEGLDGARNGIPDDLKLIKGIGPKMEKMCNSLGYYHFDQIAA